MYVYGKHPVISVLKNPERKYRRLYVTDNCLVFLQEELADKWGGIEDSLEVIPLPPKKIDNILRINTYTKGEVTHQGCLLEADALKQVELSQEILDSNLIVILDKITDPHNVGAIIRSAAAFGAAAVVTDERNSPPESAAILKTSAGCFEFLPYIRVPSLTNAIKSLKENDFELVALDGHTDENLSDYNPQNKKIALIVGSEGKGISPHVRRECDKIIKININNSVESLNASVATSLALYHLNTLS